MKYRVKVANLSQGVDLDGVQDDISELHEVYLQSQPFLGKVTEEKRERIEKSVTYVKGVIGVIQEYKADYHKRHGSDELQRGNLIKLRIA